MAADQQFCLRWNNHQSTLISVFDTLLENGTLVDCTLAAEGQYLKAHKVVLSACSPYLETLLSQHCEKHPIVILKDVKFSELKSMMDYMYRGEVNISQDQLGTFLKAAESLQIKGLSDNGDDSRDVGSTAQKPQNQPRPAVTQTRTPVESKRPAPSGDSDASRDGSISPNTYRKRRRTRRPSQGDDANNHVDSNCDIPAAQTVPSITTTPVQNLPKQIVKSEPPMPIVAPPDVKKEILDTPSEPLLEPKQEYLDYVNNENSIEVEDLTLDDDDELESSMDTSRPGPSHGDLSNQGYPAWPMTDQSGTDEIFMAAQEAVGAASQQRDSQGFPIRRRGRPSKYYKDLPTDLVLEDLKALEESGVEFDTSLFRDFLNDPSSSIVQINPETKKMEYVCPRCGKVYSYAHTLYRHLKWECQREPSFKCPHCPYRSRRKDNIKSHVIAKHEKNKKTQCFYCAKSFVHNFRLQEHLRLFHSFDFSYQGINLPGTGPNTYDSALETSTVAPVGNTPGTSCSISGNTPGTSCSISGYTPGTSCSISGYTGETGAITPGMFPGSGLSAPGFVPGSSGPFLSSASKAMLKGASIVIVNPDESINTPKTPTKKLSSIQRLFQTSTPSKGENHMTPSISVLDVPTINELPETAFEDIIPVEVQMSQEEADVFKDESEQEIKEESSIDINDSFEQQEQASTSICEADVFKVIF